MSASCVPWCTVKIKNYFPFYTQQAWSYGSPSYLNNLTLNCVPVVQKTYANKHYTKSLFIIIYTKCLHEIIHLWAMKYMICPFQIRVFCNRKQRQFWHLHSSLLSRRQAFDAWSEKQPPGGNKAQWHNTGLVIESRRFNLSQNDRRIFFSRVTKPLLCADSDCSIHSTLEIP